jgi:ABC-type uncharacterized transport system substrate-binding protein
MNMRYKKNLPGVILLLAVILCDVAGGLSQAEIILVAHQQQAAHRELVKSLMDALPEERLDGITVMRAAVLKREVLNNKWKRKPDFIVTVGTDVTLEVIALDLQTPLLAVAIPKISYDELVRRYDKDISTGRRGGFSAIYLDQPLERRFALIRQILPNARRVAIALGPGTVEYENEIRVEAERHKFDLQIGEVSDEKKLIHMLDRILDKSDVMLGLVDPLVFSRASARNILLTAYRWKVPLIGISPAYVRAGALSAVYSTPSQIGRQLAGTIEKFLNNRKKSFPRPQYPEYFSVSVNYQVAESMGIHVADEKTLEQRLSGAKGTLP